ncbi:Regulatory-associated protein of TOR [Bonamia ostreae]|uniref:Regulatory-associated protein of TOR n=1 Tax=Bonamia ostreae TaxID=126728 RepID=A0ABV2AIA6_9EUKA
MSDGRNLRCWSALMFYKMWQIFPRSKELAYNRAIHNDLLNLLKDPDPEVRAASVYSLGQLARTKLLLKNADFFFLDFSLCHKIALCSKDGSPLVRFLVLVALFRFVCRNKEHFVSESAPVFPNKNSAKFARAQRKELKLILETIDRMKRDPFGRISSCAESFCAHLNLTSF